MFKNFNTKFSSAFEKGAIGALLLFIVLPLISFAAWLTHIIVSIKAGFWLLLIAGAIVFPIGVIHGIGYWFGLFS